jgi:hypothetical protein
MPEPTPVILGRFNYLSYKPNLYNVIFMPFHGTSAAIIARNLSKEDAIALIDDFNQAIDETRKDIAEVKDDEEM